MRNLHEAKRTKQAKIELNSAQALVLDLLEWTTVKMIKEKTNLSEITIHRIAEGTVKNPHIKSYDKLLGLYCEYQSAPSDYEISDYADKHGV